MDDPRRNIYKRDVDFATLALQDDEFAKYLKTNGQLDFTDPDAVRQLTRSLLRRDFELDVNLPDDRLCPPLPNRLNYVLWIQDLVDCTAREHRGQTPASNRRVVGIDIGTGSSCIYALLACSQRPSWNMAATEIDDKNVQYTRHNLSKNRLEHRIRVVQTTPSDPLIPLADKLPLDLVDFTMCNPPFYESEEEMMASAGAKSRPPFSACTGTTVEMVTPGGEVAFVTRMIDESLVLRDKVQWYTSMLGKLSSVVALLEKLQDIDNTNYAVTELVQGNKTKRWAIAWSWSDWRPTMAVGRKISSIPKHLLPFPAEFTFLSPFNSVDALVQTIRSVVGSVDMHWQWDAATSSGTGFAAGNVWSRHARRQRTRPGEAAAEAAATSTQAPSGGTDDLAATVSAAALGFIIVIRRSHGENKPDILLRWVKGFDHVLFESFCGMLRRKVQEAGQGAPK